MRKVGCRPPYWDRQENLPDCLTNNQLRLLGTLNYSDN
jgi:hypothetical protein